jgi:5-(carboxyamino)imidazole ribonucleotide synthase
MLAMPPPGTSAVVGVVGAGQLARMMQQAAVDLGIELIVLAEHDREPAVLAGARPLIGRPHDPEAVARLAEVAEVVTLDHELVPAAILEALQGAGHAVRPTAQSIVYAQDKWAAYELFVRHGLPVPASTLVTEAAELTFPTVLKLRSGGYDGRGVEVAADAEQATRILGNWSGRDVIAQQPVDIDVEVAVVGARRPGGDRVSYPLVLTTQVDGMCREVSMPAPVGEDVARRATEIAGAVVDAVGAVGAVTVELFIDRTGAVLVNEIALRPHNSGHATIEAAATSQFHNHLRAVLDWPLGSPELITPAAAMVNVVGDAQSGDPTTRLAEALTIQGAAVHLYGKSSKPGRKLGHVTATGPDSATALRTARAAAGILNGD